MSLFLRRAAVLTTGVAAAALGLSISVTARARDVKTVADQQLCESIGGEVKQASSGEYYCLAAEKDRWCNENNRKYDKDGKLVKWYYDYKKNECIEHCFLTTACVEFAGLPDNCFELSVLRRFRDSILLGMPGGADDIALYYRVAPEIVQHIIASPRAPTELARLYALYILPSALAAQFGCYKLVRRIYTNMMRTLANRYQIALT